MKALRADKNAHMFILSMLVLFFELVCIRWFPAHVRHLGYFTNFIVIASFLGIGIGILWGKKNRILLPFFVPLLIVVQILLHFFKLQIQIPENEVLYFQHLGTELKVIEPFYMIPVVFFIVTSLFVCLSSPLGKLFDEMEPLPAYKANILGSLAGIFLFTLLCYFQSQPYVWMLLFFFFYFALFHQEKAALTLLQAFLAVIVVIFFYWSGKDSIWSFYYKITPHCYRNLQDNSVIYDVWVNNTGHQRLTPLADIAQEPMYTEIYRHFPPGSIKDMLIVGSGGGQDTACALAQAVQNIDAVEIDSVLMKFGKTLHPERPYLDPRVHLYNDDGRAFMRKATTKYDAVIFALPDSLVLSSSYSSLRLESYLFTMEAFQDVARLLKPGGIFVMYNYFRKPWLMHKLATMLELSFGYPPQIFVYPNTMTCFITGPGSKGLGSTPGYERYTPATDDWPFLYLKTRSFPGIYVKMIVSIIVISLFFYLLSPRPEKHSTNWAFFFLGAAFLLLETKSIVNFSLLFGSTWIVNSVVFFVILALVLLAILVSERYALKNRYYLYGALLITVLLNYLVPMKLFLGAHPVVLNVVAPVFYLLPIFFANLVFTYNFKDSSQAAVAFTSNMLGSILGGISEYTSMYAGYNNLLLIVLVFYILAFYFFLKKMSPPLR